MKPTPVTYRQARGAIWTGDLVAVKRPSGFLPVATRLVTRSPYTHTGIAIWVGQPGQRRLLLAQTNAGGCNLVPLSQEACYPFDVFNCPTERAAVEREIWRELGTRVPYGFTDLARIAGHLVLGLPLPRHDGQDVVCSALSARIYRRAGWRPAGLPSIPWPGAVVDSLDARPVLEIAP